MSFRSDPTRSLPDKPSLAQLREQAKELLDSYLAGNVFRGGLLAIAVRVNRIDMVATLLDLGLDPDELIPTDDGYPSWGMPLWTASMCGRHEIAELLLARGADVNAIVAFPGR